MWVKINTSAFIMDNGCPHRVNQWIEQELVLFPRSFKDFYLIGILILTKAESRVRASIRLLSAVQSLDYKQTMNGSNGSFELNWVPVFYSCESTFCQWKESVCLKQVKCRVDFHLLSYSYRHGYLNRQRMWLIPCACRHSMPGIHIAVYYLLGTM